MNLSNRSNFLNLFPRSDEYPNVSARVALVPSLAVLCLLSEPRAPNGVQLSPCLLNFAQLIWSFWKSVGLLSIKLLPGFQRSPCSLCLCGIRGEVAGRKDCLAFLAVVALYMRLPNQIMSEAFSIIKHMPITAGTRHE